MPQYLWFGLGILARAASLIAALYSDWIWNKLVEGAEATVDFLEDLWEFARWAVGELAGRLTGYTHYPPNY